MKEFLDKVFRGKLSYKNISAVFIVLIITGTIVALILIGIFDENQGMMWLSVLVMIVIFALGFWLNSIYWRCPHCEASLPMRVHKSYLVHCPRCGEKIDWNT